MHSPPSEADKTLVAALEDPILGLNLNLSHPEDKAIVLAHVRKVYEQKKPLSLTPTEIKVRERTHVMSADRGGGGARNILGVFVVTGGNLNNYDIRTLEAL